jgi:beta-glucosidase
VQTFPADFRWGTATAAYQIEGAVTEDGRGESIWDRFTHTPGNIADGSTGDVACDHYHLWGRDIEIMKQLGLNAYRFSIAWPRVVPSGKGRINQLGLDFYSRVVDGLLASRIEPAVTLYHWDLPQALEDNGGWTNRDTADYFAEYAYTVLNALSDRVSMWTTLNEPWVAANQGYGSGEHAPGRHDEQAALAASHVLHLAHAKVVNLFRSDFADAGRIGISLNLVPMFPETEADSDVARVADGFMNRWFLDPVMRGEYPADMVELYSEAGRSLDIGERDMDAIRGASVDFLGVNYYMTWTVRRGKAGPLAYETFVTPGEETTEMGWGINAPAMRNLLLRVHEEYDGPVMYITENGGAFPDTTVHEGVVRDSDRVSYLHDHLSELWLAVQEGVDVRGYYLGSLRDNFEWAHGYQKRFGIVRTDYETLDRTVKESGNWYAEVAQNNGIREVER